MTQSIIKTLWQHRHFILASVSRDFAGRYKASTLGAFWAVAQPLTLIAIYTIVFGRLIGPRLLGHEHVPYAFGIYLCAGVTAWTLFSEILTRLTSVFIDNANTIKKTTFPKMCYVAIVALSALVNYLIILALYLGFLLAIGHFPWNAVAFLPIVVAVQLMVSIGLGLLLGTLNVFFRDVQQFIQVVLQFWFWLTPIVYTTEILPDSFRAWLVVNPMVPLISAYQTLFLQKSVPDLSTLLAPFLVSVVLLWLAARLFQQTANDLVDEL